MLALLIQLFVAAFSSFLVVGLTSLYDPGSVSSGEVEMAVTGDAQDALLEAGVEHDSADLDPYGNATAAERAFNQGRVDALLNATYVESDTGDGKQIAVTARIPESSIRSTLIVTNVREILNTLERQERLERTDALESDPVPLPPEISASPYFGFTYTVLIPLLLFLPAFISGSVAVDTITEEMERGTLELLRVAPVSLLDIVDGKALGMVVLAPVQSLLWIFLLSFNGIYVANVLAILVFVTAIASLVVTIGVVLGVSTGQRRPAQLLYSVLSLFVFGIATVLPEHPATTVAKLSVDSPTLLTYAHVAGAVVLAVGAYAATRWYVDSVDASTF